ncbi:dihydrodipicolinate synthase family protein [Paraburkholderia acidisoli]|uniref:Dihydrodipicolinate synthase family protein n=1 Tax=Paraburkholderia acidisoli TaxID=2571748 RepID=A0A7Z2GGN9_9BURK|nr:dihydrodipicolinate synthase family protein [Paraburkholderia acidisoli]QGZ61124.1 dihydrodipicolinate synthase family protein [Paraburkholderia acidisoli]
MSQPQFAGIIAYPITPFNADDSLDLPALRAGIDRLIADGVHAIAPLGSTGESAYLSEDEWTAAAEASIRHVAKRVPVVVGISDLTTRNAVRRAQFAEQAGADAVMVLPISYWKLSEQEIFDHYAAIAQAISTPIMVYNNPATSGIDMSPQFIARLVREIDNVTMVKESTGDIQRMHQLRELSNGEIPFYNGSNPLALEAFCAGATGWCTAAPCLIADLTLALYRATQAGALSEARELFYKQLPVLNFILKGGLPTTVKAGLKLQGHDVGAPRRPLQPLSAEQTERLRALLKAVA